MISIAIVCEARADRDIACALADRVLAAEESIHWIDEESICHHREWRGFTSSDEMLLWKDVHALSRENRIFGFGHFAGLPGNPDAFVARKALLLLLEKSPNPPQAIVLQRDADDQPERKLGLEQARHEFQAIVPIVIGFALTKREAWVLAGFDPASDEERSRLDSIRQEIGLDPCLRSHELTAKLDQAKGSAKRVLRHLIQDDHERETHCWRITPLSKLEQRGQENGLSDYLKEIRERLIPLFR